MKAVTLYQPFASAIALGCKRIETRGHRTHHRGPIAIHAATFARPEYADVMREMPTDDAVAFVAAGYHVNGAPSLLKLPQACIVAIAEIQTVCSADDLAAGAYKRADGSSVLTESERYWGNYAAGRFGWVLVNIRRLATPIPARGYQGLWDWTPPADLAARFVSDSVPSVSELRAASVAKSDSVPRPA